MSGSVHISELGYTFPNGGTWAAVRSHFDIQSFGVNAYVAERDGVELIGEHDELGERSGKHQELYFVSAGQATFTVNGDEIDAPAGTFVFVRDLAAKRKAVADEAGTTVVIVGGRPGEAFTPSPWERTAKGLVHFANKDYEQAAKVYGQLLEETPEDAGLLYNLACAESLLGRKDDALGHLRRSVELDDDFRQNAREDPDFDAIRGEAEFSAIAGEPDAGGESP